MATIVGAVLLVPAAWVEFGTRDAAWWLDGIGLVAGATGAALLWTGVFGLRPDWTDETGVSR